LFSGRERLNACLTGSAWLKTACGTIKPAPARNIHRPYWSAGNLAISSVAAMTISGLVNWK
jgi:hypothetical protein